MKVILDANVFISALISKNDQSLMKKLVRACLLQPEITLIFPRELKAEILSVWARKLPLQQLVSRETLDFVMKEVERVADIPSPIREADSYSRDPKDDYLIAYGLMEEVGYLVTGDKDLLVLEHIQQLQIISPVEFSEILAKLES